MYRREREKLPKRHKYPSFSTTLLDEIYRSIDGFDEKHEDFVEVKKYNNGNRITSSGKNGCRKVIKTVRLGDNNVDDDEDVVSFRRACLVEKWMEQKVSDKVTMTRGIKLPPTNASLSDFDSDPLFFSSSSSDSSSGVLSSDSSLSETEFLEASRKSSSLRTSCFSSKPKPVRTRVENPEKTGQEKLMKSKSAAGKMYASLKKMRQPISPGARLTNFLNSLFAANGKPKNSGKDKTTSEPPTQPSTSASRSCLNKTPRINNGVKRTVRFDPVGVIVDEDCRPCGHKRIIAGGESSAPEFQETKKNHEISRGISHYHQWKHDFYTNQEDEDDKLSDCSSDLFEIDHLALFGNRRFREELPVYETTHLDTNRAIASGFIRR